MELDNQLVCKEIVKAKLLGFKVMALKHPAIIQFRGDFRKWIEELLPVIEKTCNEFYVDKVKGGLNIYVSDVNEARNAISKIQKIRKAKIQMSTKYAGLRKGRVRVLFVYCLRF